MIVDCDGCAMRNRGCDDCMVSVLLGMPEPFAESVDSGHSDESVEVRDCSIINFQQDERDAMVVLAEGGLLPRLRLVSPPVPDSTPDCDVSSASNRSRLTG